MSFVVFVSHEVLPGHLEDAAAAIGAAGQLMSAYRGFVSRNVLYRSGEFDELATVTAWDSKESFERWMTSRERQQLGSGPDILWARKPEARHYVLYEPNMRAGGEESTH